MGDLYFNELSVDFSFSVQPQNEEEAKDLLLQFIQAYYAYKVSSGHDSVYILSYVRLSLTHIVDVFGSGKFFVFLNELESDNKITDEEKKLFKAAISETYIPEWNPEFYYLNHIAFGFGKAYLNKSFSISFSNNYNNGGNSWNHYVFKILEHRLNNDSRIEYIDRLSNNISTIKHVVENHEIWDKCIYINKHPSRRLLPKKNQSEFVVKSLTGFNWDDFYKNQQRIDNVTIKKKIGHIVACINGWQECKTKDHRKTFTAGNRYIAIDTENSTFEYYIGTDDHKGEIKFHDEQIITKKGEETRKIELA